MKKKLVLLASLAAGVAAAVLTHMFIASKEAEVAEQRKKLEGRYGSMEVLCFGVDTPAGTVLSRKDLATKEVPGRGLEGQALTKADVQDILGRKTLVSHSKADVVFWADIDGGDPSVHGLSADIKRNMRAISINCSGAAAVSSMVRPSDHVDVIGTFDFGAETGQRNFVTCTILQNVLVLATGDETAKKTFRGDLGLERNYSLVTLEVTPREAEMIAFAEQMKGRLVLTLRNRNDTTYEKELPQVDFEKIRGEIEELNLKRQQQRLTNR